MMGASRSARHLLVWGALLFVGCALIWRLGQLHLVNDDFLQHQGDRRAIRTVDLPNYRGMILDRNGEALAVSSPVPSIWVNVTKADLNDPRWDQLASILEQNGLTQSLQKNATKTFYYLKRQVSPVIANKVESLGLDGVHIQTEYKRFYPTGEVSAHVVGMAGIDNQGIEGFELALDEALKGVPGTKKVIRDRLGHQIDVLDEGKSAINGQDIQLSIDSRLQYLAYRALQTAVKKHGAKAGSLVALHAKTGEVLAMANYPSYNPNFVQNADPASLRNRAVTDQFEPGSVIKPFSMAHILSSGQFYPHTRVDTSPGWVKVGTKVVKDVKNFGNIDLGTVITKSSNVGITKLMLSLPPNGFYDLLGRVGFGYRTDSGFPGEAPGKIQYRGQHNDFALATLGFGYGISVTPLQLAQAYSVFANDGVRKPVSFLKTHTTPSGEKVMSSAVAQTVKQMLAQVTQPGGTARQAQVAGYNVAGKTGTARKVGPNGYSEDRHLALFAGFAPVENPEVVIAVVVDEPSSGHYYGGQVAAPVFSEVMHGALRLLNVSPWGRNQEYLLVKK